MAKRAPRKKKADPKAEPYQHKQAESLLRPEIGLQAQFKQKKAAVKYQYDPTLDPQLQWAGKAERTSFEVPTLPLFIHERLSTKAILETLKGHARDRQMQMLFADPDLSITDRILKAYQHKDRWVNRMVLGDSLAAMNSLLHYEGLGGQVQMIYMDPPYGVKFGSNFQPFVRKRDVKHNDDQHMTREPEMVQAYRDTWELGIHSYLTYLRDRLLLCRELLAPSGSIFVQIGQENVHNVRELLDEIFGAENFCSLITYRTSVPLTSAGLGGVTDYVLWYARDKTRYTYNDLFISREAGEKSRYASVELPDGTRRPLTADEKLRPELLPEGSRVFGDMDLASSGYTPSCIFDFEYNGKVFRTSSGKSWKTTKQGMQRLADAGRITDSGKTIRYLIYFDDFPVTKLTNFWQDTTGELEKEYVVQTHTKVVQRCMLMTTKPGDLVLDPTCGSGTTAYVAEQWGRALDYHGHFPRASGAGAAAAPDRHLPLLRTERPRQRPGGGLRLSAQAEQKRRRSRGHRSSHHAQEHRQKRAAG